MLILGIDPGYATVGYGLVQHERGKFTHIRHGAITTQPHVPMHLRLKEIHEDMLTLLDTFHPDAVSVEELFLIRTLRPAFRLPMRAGLFCWRAPNAALHRQNIRRHRSNNRLSATAGRKSGRLWK